MISYLGGLRKEFHHVKTGTESGDDYEPAMVVMKHELKGRSFIIPLEAMWKYLDPKDNVEARVQDRRSFMLLRGSAMFKLGMATNPRDKEEAAAGVSCCMVAEALAKGMGFLLCTSWNLAKIMQMMEITPCPQAAAQLLLWIQDGLDQLKNMPPCPEDDVVGVGGGMALFADGRQIAAKDMIVTETNLAEEARDGNI
ncbi:MAG: hypothetical protein ABIH23_13680 [bacterium]